MTKNERFQLNNCIADLKVCKVMLDEDSTLFRTVDLVQKRIETLIMDFDLYLEKLQTKEEHIKEK